MKRFAVVAALVVVLAASGAGCWLIVGLDDRTVDDSCELGASSVGQCVLAKP